MPSSKGDLTLFCQGLQATSALLGWAKVLPGKNSLPLSGSGPRVVIWPIGAITGIADDNRASVASSWMLLTAHFWSRPSGSDPGGIDNAFDLRERFFQALRIQADGKSGAPGYFWKNAEGMAERWDQQPADTSEQGQEFEIDFLIRIDAPLAPSYLTTGTVGATSMARVATLETGLGNSDVTVVVDATFEQIASGVLHIDDEQMSFSGVTATSFTGVVRGINGTTAATHSSGAAVYVSPT